jgi:hypothetical protein
VFWIPHFIDSIGWMTHWIMHKLQTVGILVLCVKTYKSGRWAQLFSTKFWCLRQKNLLIVPTLKWIIFIAVSQCLQKCPKIVLNLLWRSICQTRRGKAMWYSLHSCGNRTACTHWDIGQESLADILGTSSYAKKTLCTLFASSYLANYVAHLIQ